MKGVNLDIFFLSFKLRLSLSKFLCLNLCLFRNGALKSANVGLVFDIFTSEVVGFTSPVG
jgi:hypothetical protein